MCGNAYHSFAKTKHNTNSTYAYDYDLFMSFSCEVAVVGAGPAGAITALQLTQAGCSVVLLERSKFDRPRVGESLAPDVQPLLVSLGLWPQFLTLKPLPSYGTRSAWGSSDAEDHSHLMTAYMNGWHIDRLAFDRMLAHAALQCGTQVYLASRITCCQSIGHDGFVLRIANTEGTHELRTKFLIDASGRHSCMASPLGARRTIFDRLIGVAAQFYDDNASSNCYTLVETTPDGWWYSAPVSLDRSVVMLMTDGDLARLQDMDLLTNWQKALHRAKLTEARFNGSGLCWGPRIYSAVSQRLMKDPADSKPWLAVGDAALSVDPISGSGVIRAFRTAREAAAAALAVLNGDAGAMANYEAQRNSECTKYLIERTIYYGMEERWPEATFWKRRAVVFRQLMDRQLPLSSV